MKDQLFDKFPKFKKCIDDRWLDVRLIDDDDTYVHIRQTEGLQEWLEENKKVLVLTRKPDPRNKDRFKKCREEGSCCHKGWSYCYAGTKNHPYFKKKE